MPKIAELLGDKAEYLLTHSCKTIDKSIASPSANHVDEIWINSNRNNQVLRSMDQLLNYGRLAGTGYCSIFPVDQGIEHSAGAHLHLILFILILKILSSWLLKQVVMQWRQLMECWEL